MQVAHLDAMTQSKCKGLTVCGVAAQWSLRVKPLLPHAGHQALAYFLQDKFGFSLVDKLY